MITWLTRAAINTGWLILGGYALVRMLERER